MGGISKKEKMKTTSANIHIRINGKVINIIARRRIYLHNSNEGMLSDGRPVRKEKGKWYYDPL